MTPTLNEVQFYKEVKEGMYSATILERSLLFPLDLQLMNGNV
jgi:hypothetical protein